MSAKMPRLIPWLLKPLTGLWLALAPIAVQSQDPVTELSRLQSSGAPTTIAELKTPIPGGETNIAVLLQPIRERTLAIDGAVNDHFPFTWHPELSSSFFEAWDTATRQHDIFDVLETAVECRYWVPLLDYSPESAQTFIDQLNKDTTWLRSMARVNIYRARMQLLAGDADAAALTALNTIELARLHPRFCLTDCLTCNTVQQMGLSSLGEVLQHSDEISLKTHQQIDDELAQHDSLEPFTQCLIGERVVGLQILRDQGVVGIFGIESYLKTLRMAIDESGKTIGQQPELIDPDEHGIHGALFEPAAQMARHSAHRSLALVRCLRIANQFRSSMVDGADLDKIDLPETTKTDPYDNQPLRVLEAEHGIVVYSVSRDRRDNGGKLLNDLNDDDLGFELLMIDKP
jgi:hypothetical protein